MVVLSRFCGVPTATERRGAVLLVQGLRPPPEGMLGYGA